MGLDDGDWEDPIVDYYEKNNQFFFDSALICENGHIVNKSKRQFPEDNKNYCEKCGKPSIDKCPKCNSDIRGQKYNGNHEIAAQFIKPSFCFNCGEMLPWTFKAIEAACELASDNLQKTEIDNLRKSLDEITRDTPYTVIAVKRIKEILPKIPNGLGKAFREILISIMTEAAKKAMFP